MRVMFPELTVIGPGCSIASDVTIWPFTTIGHHSCIGRGCVIGSNVYVGNNCTIMRRTRIQHGVFLPNDTLIEYDVFIGPMVVMTDDKNPVCGNKGYDAQPPLIRAHASIGAGAVILPGVVIGKHARIGAGAIVSKNVAPFAVVRGDPARVTRMMDAS